MLLRRCFYILFLIANTSVAADLGALSNRAVTVAIDETPNTFNPYAKTELISQQFKHLFFDPLLRWNKHYQLENRLISGWKRINDKQVRFYLRKQVYFHSGNELTAKDVIWSVDNLFRLYEERMLNRFISIKQVDNYSFDIFTELSDLQLLDSLTYLFVLDSAFYQQHDKLLSSKPAILLAPIEQLPLSGTGPYKVFQYNPALGIEVIANQDYWAAKPAINYFRFLKIKQPQSRLYALLADDVQISYSIPNNKIRNIEQDVNKSLVSVPLSNAIFLTLNDAHTSILSDKKVRQALHLAINQQGMLKHILNGRGRVHSSFMSIAEAEFAKQNQLQQPLNADAEDSQVVYDLAKAKSLLKGVKLPKKISLLVMLDEVGNTEKVAIALANMLNKVGIRLDINKVNSREYWQQNWQKYDLTLCSWHTWLISRENVHENLFEDSLLTGYLKNKFEQAQVKQDYHSRAAFFSSLQKQEWLIPILFQDKLWADNGGYNLQAIFSANGIPYWSLLKPVEIKPTESKPLETINE